MTRQFVSFLGKGKMTKRPLFFWGQEQLVSGVCTFQGRWIQWTNSKIWKSPYCCREWSLLKNLPKISVLDGCPMSRADLRWFDIIQPPTYFHPRAKLTKHFSIRISLFSSYRAIKINFCRTCIILSAKVKKLLKSGFVILLLLTNILRLALCYLFEFVDKRTKFAWSYDNVFFNSQIKKRIWMMLS